MNSIWKAEPTMVLSVVSAGVALGVGFGLKVSTQQMGLIMAFAAAVLGLINRSQVTSPATLQTMTQASLVATQVAAEPSKIPAASTPISQAGNLAPQPMMPPSRPSSIHLNK